MMGESKHIYDSDMNHVMPHMDEMPKCFPQNGLRGLLRNIKEART